MSSENVETVEKVAKVAKVELPTITEFVELDVVVEEKIAFVEITDGAAYAQVASAVKEMTNVKLVSSAKEGIVIIEASEKNTAAVVKYINPALVDASKVIIKITYGEFPKLRISAKVAGTSKIKQSTRSTFFDRNLENVIDEGDYNYIYGVDGTEFTKALNTKIARVVKTLCPGVLYSDALHASLRGFHKTNTKIPPNDLGLRTGDNYTFFFKWDLILNLGEVVGPKCIETIKAIFKEVYPNLELDTSKPLYIECLKSEFSLIGKERLIWDETESKIVSKKAIIEKEKEAAKLEKEAAKAAADAEKKAKKEAAKKAAAEAVSDSPVASPAKQEVATPATPATPVTPVTPAPVSPAPVTPVSPAPVINGKPADLIKA